MYPYKFYYLACGQMSKRHDQTKMHDIPQRYEAHGLWKDLIPNICIKEQKTRPSDIWQWYEAYGLWKYLITNYFI